MSSATFVKVYTLSQTKRGDEFGISTMVNVQCHEFCSYSFVGSQPALANFTEIAWIRFPIVGPVIPLEINYPYTQYRTQMKTHILIPRPGSKIVSSGALYLELKSRDYQEKLPPNCV